MNWLKRLLRGGTAVTVETEADRNLREASERVLNGRSAADLLRQMKFPCNGTNLRHSWKPRGLSESSESCLRCGMAR